MPGGPIVRQFRECALTILPFALSLRRVNGLVRSRSWFRQAHERLLPNCGEDPFEVSAIEAPRLAETVAHKYPCNALFPSQSGLPEESGTLS